MRQDDAYLLDMFVAAQEARQLVTEMTWEAFSASRLHQLAILHLVQTIGEAATRVSPEGRAATPTIPWSLIIGMRHRLVHDYDRVSLTVAWETVRNDLPRLIEALRPFIPSEDQYR